MHAFSKILGMKCHDEENGKSGLIICLSKFCNLCFGNCCVVYTHSEKAFSLFSFL